MGDRIAIMKDGALVQYDTPEAILSAPADAFVEAFVGADRALKRLALIPVAAAAEAAVALPAGMPTIGADASLRDALSRMLAQGVDALAIDGANASVVTLAGIRTRTAASGALPRGL